MLQVRGLLTRTGGYENILRTQNTHSSGGDDVERNRAIIGSQEGTVLLVLLSVPSAKQRESVRCCGGEICTVYWQVNVRSIATL